MPRKNVGDGGSAAQERALAALTAGNFRGFGAEYCMSRQAELQAREISLHTPVCKCSMHSLLGKVGQG